MNQIEQGYPKVMVHPGYAPAVNSTELYKGAPARWPPITVYKNEDEQKERAKGYHPMGEPQPERIEFSEYPMMLVHPDHVDAVPEEKTAVRENGQLIITSIPGKSEKWPHVTVNNDAEREVQELKGYHVPTQQNPDAFLTAKTKPKIEEEPPAHDEYPKWVNGKVVKNRDEENALLGISTPVLVQAVADVPDDDLLAKYRALLAENAELKRKRGGRPKKIKLKAEKHIGEPLSPPPSTS